MPSRSPTSPVVSVAEDLRNVSECEGRERHESPLGMYWPRRFRDSQCARDLDPVHSFLLEPPLASPSQSRCVVYVCTEVPGHGF